MATNQPTTNRNTYARRALALASVPLLAVPSAMGVYGWLAPESGPWAAGSAAVGFEALYVGVNILVLRSPELRRYAGRVSVAAVATAVIFNTLYHYGAKVEGAYTGAPFAWLPFVLALLASMPLAGLAYATSVLMHRLSEDEASQPAEQERTPAAPSWAGRVLVAEPAATWARVDLPDQPIYPAPVRIGAIDPDAVKRPSSPEQPTNAPAANGDGVRTNSSNTEPAPAAVYSCRHCGAEGLTKAEQLTHGRQHARERQQEGRSDA